jgi:pimeloyl-ACP methyl ester carboxylesterase
MANAEAIYGLKPLGGTDSGRAVIVLHGIRQTRDDVMPFAEQLAKWAKHADVYVYGYDHTQALVTNGTTLAETVALEVKAKRIDLVGYSMGGLVARLAASDRHNPSIHTVVTIATPNRGSLSNAELTTLGQIGRGAFEFISPLAPRSEGVKDLTRASAIMSGRRDRLLAESKALGVEPALNVRYASIPALFYNPARADVELGPSIALSALQTAILMVGFKARMVRMKRPHDGIVTEFSNNVVEQASYDWSELRLAREGLNGEPARCHVVLDECRNQDHGTIMRAADIALLSWTVLECADWRGLEAWQPLLHNRISAAV